MSSLLTIIVVTWGVIFKIDDNLYEWLLTINGLNFLWIFVDFSILFDMPLWEGKGFHMSGFLFNIYGFYAVMFLMNWIFACVHEEAD